MRSMLIVLLGFAFVLACQPEPCPQCPTLEELQAAEVDGGPETEKASGFYKKRPLKKLPDQKLADQRLPLKDSPLKYVKPPSTSSQPDPDLPDLVVEDCRVVCPDLAIGDTSPLCESHTVTSDNSIGAFATMINRGKGAAIFEEGWNLYKHAGILHGGNLYLHPGRALYLPAGETAEGYHSPGSYRTRPDPGTYNFYFTVDPDNRVEESNESNNTIDCKVDGQSVLTVTEAPPTDLIVASVTASPPTGTPSTEFEFTVTVKNNSESNVKDNAHLQCGSWIRTIGTLAAGDEVSMNFSLSNQPPGNRSVSCNVDIHNVVQEANEDNNTTVGNYVVTEP